MAQVTLRAKSSDAASLAVLGFGPACYKDLLSDGRQEFSPALLLHESIGPLLFRPINLKPAWLTWNGGIIAKLAQSIYDERAFDRLPVLADALEEAGCTNADMLSHCRGPGPHVRGCWVVDLLLGKE